MGYKDKLDGLEALTSGPVARKALFEEIQRTSDHMEVRLNSVLLKADAQDIPHIPQAEKDKVKDEAMAEFKKIKEISKKAKQPGLLTSKPTPLKYKTNNLKRNANGWTY